MLERGPSGSGGGLHAFGRLSFSARSDDTERWSECDFPPTSAVQGVCQRVRQPKRFAQAQIVQPQMCQRGRASAADTSEEINNFHSCHMKSRVQNGMRLQLWLWQQRPLASPCASQPARDRRAPTTVSTYYARFHHSTSRKKLTSLCKWRKCSLLFRSRALLHHFR